MPVSVPRKPVRRADRSRPIITPPTIELLQSIVSTSPIASHVIDLDRRVMLWNPASERTFGWSAREVLGKPLPAAMTPPADRASSVERIRRALAGAEIRGERVRRLTKRGEERWIDIYAAPLVDGDGQQIGIASQLVDVTERVNLETELLQSQKIGAIGLLASGIAYDFDNLLTVAAGYAELIRRTYDGAVVVDAAAIGQVIERGRQLAHQLGAFARRGNESTSVVDLREVVRGIEPLIRRLIDAPVAVEVRLGDEPVYGRVQPDQLEQALINLALNARDAMPGGGVLTISVGVGGGEAAIDVADTGTGIDPAIVGKVFDPFFTTKPAGQGTGLGLAMVRGFAENADGRLLVRSEVGCGTTFTIRLPESVPPSDGGVV